MAGDLATTHPIRRLISNRRGVLAGAAALVGAGLTKLAGPTRVEAGHNNTTAYSSEGVLHVDVTNTTAGRTTISGSSATTPLVVQNSSSDTPIGPCGVFAATSPTSFSSEQGAGVFGLSTLSFGNGVAGLAEATSGIGVYGAAANKFVAQSGVPGSGVFGYGPTHGISGRSPSGAGAYGTSTSGAGVYGQSQSNAGVFGDSPLVAVAGVTTNGLGVQGSSTTNAGVFGQSSGNAGVFGISPYAGVQGSSTGIAVWGQSNGGTAVFGQSLGPTGWAGQFAGNVYITGSLTVASGAKSAAVKRKDGSHARVYCQESPEPWFEDFGRGKLTNGQATVKLDPDFADMVRADDYSVFPVAEGDCNGLYVASKSAQGFEVRELRGGTSAVPFGYRVVARRADRVGGRLEKVDVPIRSAAPPPAEPKGVDRKDLPQPVAAPRAEAGGTGERRGT